LATLTDILPQVEASKSRSHSAEANRAGVATEEKVKSVDQTTESRRASQTSVARRKTKPALPNSKPINLDQIRSIKQAVDNAIAVSSFL